MPSVKQIIYINTDKPSITIYNRTPKPNQWLNVDHTNLNEKVKILNRSVAMTKIYQRIEFEIKQK